jgi:hypothetical protein
MADAHDLHQIEYRHHQTRDLSPAATSMTSRESLSGWDSRIRAWVRHPHADKLPESACYQVFPNGQAALAWRYFDERAASRGDGTRGRPLVSRVLAGPASVLTFEVALASCRTGPVAEWLGPLPGEVADGSQLPMVSGEALAAQARTMTPELDRAAAGQKGLQAVVAAALAEPSVPLAISIQDVLIQTPPREGVQYPLLWGLHGIAGPLLGQAGRGWSFSTYELPLGETDPASLPAIVFREARAGVNAPPSRWRREAKVRPFEASALEAGTAYAELVELASWLVAEYQDRGGNGLERFIAECGGASFPLRIGRVSDALRKAHQPPSAFPYQKFAGLPRPRPLPAVAEPASAAERHAVAEPDSLAVPDSVAEPPAVVEPPAVAEQQDAGPRIRPAGPASAPQSPAAPQRDWYQSPEDALGSSREGQEAPPLPLPGHGGHPVAGGQLMPGGHPMATRRPEGEGASRASGVQEPASSLLRQLELLGEDQELFESILDRLYQAGGLPPEERGRCWSIVSSADWYEHICRSNSFRSGDLARILGLIVLPELAERPPAEAIARWAVEAPAPLIEGLLAAARMAGPEMRDIVMDILEPALAYRWTIEKYMRDYWDGNRATHPRADPGRGEDKGGRFGLRRRAGRRT